MLYRFHDKFVLESTTHPELNCPSGSFVSCLVDCNDDTVLKLNSLFTKILRASLPQRCLSSFLGYADSLQSPSKFSFLQLQWGKRPYFLSGSEEFS